jgi:hypothetical protein
MDIEDLVRTDGLGPGRLLDSGATDGVSMKMSQQYLVVSQGYG